MVGQGWRMLMECLSASRAPRRTAAVFHFRLAKGGLRRKLSCSGNG
jgi:hypothetical protein